MGNNFNEQNGMTQGIGEPESHENYGAPVQSGYRPYMSYSSQYGTVNMNEVTPQEKKALKKHYFGTFTAAIIHGVGSFILAQLFFMLMAVFGYEFRYTDDGVTIIDWIYELAGSLPSIIFCIGIFLYDKGASHVSARDYFSVKKLNAKTVFGFFGMVMFAYGAAIVCQSMLINGMFSMGISPISEDYLTETELTPLYLAVSLVTTAVLAPVAEELMFRGVILRRLSSVSQSFAIFMSALIFGLMHGNFAQCILGIILGIVFGYAAVKTGSLILPIAGHILVNFTASMNSIAEYNIGEDGASFYWTAIIIVYIIVGILTFLSLLAAHSIRFPEFREYHKKRTFPIVITCVSFWVMMCIYLIECIRACGPVTDKLMGE